MSNTQFSMLGIMNAALLSQGLEEINENDGTNEWRLLSRNWASIVEAELEDGGYHFTVDQQQLNTRTNGKFGFDDGYLVPSASMHIRRLWITDGGSDVAVDWVQDSSYVYLDNPDGCYVEFVMVPGEHLWGANFSRGVQKRLEALIARAIKEELQEAVSLEQEAETYFQRARTVSSKSGSPQRAFKQGPIARARNGRG